MAKSLDRLSYARSMVITAPLIFLYTGIMASLSVASSFIDSTGRIQHACSRIWARMILFTARVRVSVRGMENVKAGRPYVLCVNHQSHMDIPILLAALPFQFRFAAKKELFRYPFLGWHLSRAGHISIDRRFFLRAGRVVTAASSRSKAVVSCWRRNPVPRPYP